ncbi:hypothetical protein [Anaerococcus sp. Marseille-P9784]|uniref:hypothetical protein n=1 Tax=Anaerococcus sp. Marseille-P9784 TaxID=2614127 RepID=UPI001249FEEA|nr:hypothetical protein [Anaerococcus sp. Marseille-P9784]
MKIIKKIVPIFLVSVSLLLSYSSYAANTKNENFHFEFSNFSLAQFTNARDKEDASPIFMYVKSLTQNRSFYARVVNEDGSFTTYSPKYKISYVNAKYCLHSNAYENKGYGVKVKIRGDRIGIGQMFAGGFWSSDSYSCPWE